MVIDFILPLVSRLLLSFGTVLSFDSICTKKVQHFLCHLINSYIHGTVSNYTMNWQHIKERVSFKTNFNNAMWNYFLQETCSENYDCQQITSAIHYKV